MRQSHGLGRGVKKKGKGEDQGPGRTRLARRKLPTVNAKLGDTAGRKTNQLTEGGIAITARADGRR